MKRQEEEITFDNLHEFVTVRDCGLCPPSSGCLNSNPSYLPLQVCYCSHDLKPMRLGTECERRWITPINNIGAKPIPVYTIRHVEDLIRNNGTKLPELQLCRETGPFLSTVQGLLFIASILSLVLIITVCLVKRRSFGKVLKGELRKNESVGVALKAAKVKKDEKETKVTTFSHPNNIPHDSEFPWLNFAYMGWKWNQPDKNLSSSSSFHKEDVENGETQLDRLELEIDTESPFNVASQIAEGMK